MGGGGTGKNELTIDPVDRTKDKTIFDMEDSYRKQVIVDDKPCLLDLLEIAGGSEYSSMQDQWMREGKAFIIFYSITSRVTFDEALILRDKVIRVREEECPPIVLVGNKCELTEQRQVTTEEGQNLIKEWGEYCSFFEISTNKRINCEQCLYECVRLIRRSRMSKTDEIENLNNPKQDCCTSLVIMFGVKVLLKVFMSHG